MRRARTGHRTVRAFIARELNPEQNEVPMRFQWPLRVTRRRRQARRLIPAVAVDVRNAACRMRMTNGNPKAQDRHPDGEHRGSLSSKVDGRKHHDYRLPSFSPKYKPLSVPIANFHLLPG